MAILQKLEYSKIFSMCNLVFSGDFHLNPVFRSENRSLSWSSFDRNNYWRFALRSRCDESGPLTHPGPESMPLSVELEPIFDESQFDAVIGEAQRHQDPVVILWLASWCRKCIYLKPKLERFAADYFPRIRFYAVDVNKVPHHLVARAGVTKMPTIQLWRDGQMQGEVIGGHSAHLVVNDIRDIIENQYDTTT